MRPLRYLFSRLSQSENLDNFFTHGRGRNWTKEAVKMFVAGETMENALPTAEEYGRRGIGVSFSHLGESLKDPALVEAEVEETLKLIEYVKGIGFEADISVKPSHMGAVAAYPDPEESCRVNLGRIVRHAKRNGVGVQLDQEWSALTDFTFSVYSDMRRIYEKVMTAVQSTHRRAEQYAKDILEEKGSLRLVKGAYTENSYIAYTGKQEIDENFERLLDMTLSAGIPEESRVAIATHDMALVDYALELIERNSVPKKRYEFQMLHGIRKKDLYALASEGHPTRVYLSYGKEWYPFFMRRVAEKPSNLVVMARNYIENRLNRNGSSPPS